MKSLSSFFFKKHKKIYNKQRKQFFLKKKGFGKRKLEPTYKIQRREKDFFFKGNRENYKLWEEEKTKEEDGVLVWEVVVVTIICDEEVGEDGYM